MKAEIKTLLLALSLSVLPGVAIAASGISKNDVNNFSTIPFPTVSEKPQWVQVFKDGTAGGLLIDKASIRMENRLGTDYIVYREKQSTSAEHCGGVSCTAITYYAMIPEKVAANALLTQNFDSSGSLKSQSYYDVESWNNMDIYSNDAAANAVLEYLKKQVGQDKFGQPEHVQIGG